MVDIILFRLFSYCSYFLQARSIQKIHSPFVYNWYKIVKSPLDEKSENYINQYNNTLKKNSKELPLQYSNKNSTVSKRYYQTKISQKGGRLLHHTADYLKTTKVLELGTSLGMSALYIATSKEVKEFYTLDREDSHLKIVQEYFPKELLSKLDLVSGEFQNTLEPTLQKAKKINMAFIDGDHSNEGTMDNVKKILPFMDDTSVIILDDIRWSRGMKKAWDELSDDKLFSYVIDMGRYGLLFTCENKAPHQKFILW